MGRKKQVVSKQEQQPGLSGGGDQGTDAMKTETRLPNQPLGTTKPVGEKFTPDVGGMVALLTYSNYFLMTVIGHIRDICGYLTGLSRYKQVNPVKNGYSSLFKSQESFFTRRLYHRLQDCWNRPLCSGPGVRVDVMERVSTDNNCTFSATGKSINCLNLGSYNYLGFADDWKITCRDDVFNATDYYPNSTCSPRANLGTTDLHNDLEEVVANFVGKEAAVVFPMGFNTNALTVPVLMSEGTLIVSDSLNHTSIVNGARGSAAQIRVFRHNEHDHLEAVLREAIVGGQPRHHRPWKKILVMVEGIYSMEGNICNLKDIVRVCKKYNAYIYVDEAHSIGALGKTGRGICEHAGVDPADVDILMGTFTKSFSGMGGYIAGDRATIDFIKARSTGLLSSTALCPIVTQQVLTAFKVIMGTDGTDIGRKKLNALMTNSNYFRERLVDLGLHVYGDYDSPIIPVMIYQPGKISAFSRECLKRGLAVVVVGFPATSIIYSRARFCISAGHTKDQLDWALNIIDDVAKLLAIKYSKSILGFDELKYDSNLTF